MTYTADMYLGCNAVLVTAVLCLLLLRIWRRDPYAISTMALISSGVALAAWLFTSLPTTTVWALGTTLYEGGSAIAAEVVMGFVPSSQPNGAALSQLTASQYTVPLEGLHRANLVLSAGALFAFSAMAINLLKSRIAGLLAPMALLLSPLFWAGATSEFYGPLVFVYTVAATLFFSELRRITSPSRGDTWRRYLAAAGVVLCAFLAAQTRIATAAVGLPAAVLALVELRLGGSRFQRRITSLHRRAALWIQRELMLLRPRFVLGLAGIVFGLKLLIPLADTLHLPFAVIPALLALNPLDITTLGLFNTLWDTTSIGIVALILLGLWVTLRQPLSFGLLGLGTLAMYRAYRNAGHSGTAPYEMVRYGTILLPLFAILTLLGWREVQRILPDESPHGERRRGVLGGLLILSLIAAPPALAGLRLSRNITLRAWVDSPALAVPLSVSAPTIDTNAGWISQEMQREVRFLAAALRQDPTCRIVLPYLTRGGSLSQRPAAETALSAAGFLVLDAQATDRFVAVQTLAELRAWPDFARRCTHFYVGLDCHQAGAPPCGPGPDAGHLKVLAKTDFAYEGYSEPAEHGIYLGPISLRLYDGLPQ